MMLLINETSVENTHLNRRQALFQLLHEQLKYFISSLQSYATVNEFFYKSRKFFEFCQLSEFIITSD